MELRDDDLSKFAVEGATQLPPADVQGHVEHYGALIWYATHGSGSL